MKLGIFSDVHGNIEALETVLDFCQRQEVTEYVCLGDIVGYGADPEECVQRIRGLRCTIVAGNHDYAAVEQTSLASFNDAARRALLWTRKQLSGDSLAFLKALELVEFLPAYSFRLVHSAPSTPRDWGYIETWSDIEYEFHFFPDRTCLIGHSHIPFIVRKDPAASRPARVPVWEFDLPDDGCKYLINVGSVGQPRDGDPRACIAIFNARAKRMQLHRLEYDVATAQRKIVNAGLPESLALRLSRGQ